MLIKEVVTFIYSFSILSLPLSKVNVPLHWLTESLKHCIFPMEAQDIGPAD
jgi:hypothetical protein